MTFSPQICGYRLLLAILGKENASIRPQLNITYTQDLKCCARIITKTKSRQKIFTLTGNKNFSWDKHIYTFFQSFKIFKFNIVVVNNAYNGIFFIERKKLN